MAATDITDQEGVIELLERHRPLLRFDAQEPYLAIAADSITRYPGNVLTGADGAVIAAAGSGLDLDVLSEGRGGDADEERERLREAPDVLAAARELQAVDELAERCYGRAARDGEWIWLQYFFWEYYNPKHLLGFGKHEGDWELIQIGLDPDERLPRVATYAQHDGGAAREWEEIERRQTPEGEHPVVYVAPFSHASYFEARTHWHPGGPDSPDGRGPSYRPQLERFGEWVHWRGRWGASTGVLGRLARGRLGGRSPESPAVQTGRWEEPTAFHLEAARKRRRGIVDRTLWRIGKRTFPKEPELRARLEHGSVVGESDPGRTLLRRPTQLHVTVHDATSPDQPVLKSAVVGAEEAAGFRIPLPPGAEEVIVRATQFNALRQRSDPTELRLSGAEAEP